MFINNDTTNNTTTTNIKSASTSKIFYLMETETTRLQQETEDECGPFFVNLSTLTPGQKEHLIQVGLLSSSSSSSASNDSAVNDESMRNHIRLLRDKHGAYLKQVWTKPSLKAPFVSLDASRPWILYWCLHGYDLLHGGGGCKDKNYNLQITNPQGWKMVETLRDCWQSYYTTDVPSIIIENDDDQLYFVKHEQDLLPTNHEERCQYYCGGFGGGPNQMAHAATTYAAVLALCILATDNDDTDCDDADHERQQHYSIKAQQLLQEIRIPLYRWMISLQQPRTGGYRMHHDGEVDVRATYTIMACAKLLKLVSSSSCRCVLQRSQVIDFVVSCQTYEGGMGGEPFSEAHGGYTFCGLAALHLMGALKTTTSGDENDNSITTHTKHHHSQQPQHQQPDMSSLIGWLARRQMSYEGGFSGRSNKLVDGCYSFWQGGAMAIASSYYRCGNDDNTTNNDDDSDCNKSDSKTDNHSYSDDDDPWLQNYQQRQHQHHQQYENHDDDDESGCIDEKEMMKDSSSVAEDMASSSSSKKASSSMEEKEMTSNNDERQQSSSSFPLLFDVAMLERYILLCAQDVHGGLRDKPSKPRDFYHTCYNLSGLSVAQHCSSSYDDNEDNDNNNDQGYGDQQHTLLASTHPCYNIRIDRVICMLNKTWGDDNRPNHL